MYYKLNYRCWKMATDWLGHDFKQQKSSNYCPNSYFKLELPITTPINATFPKNYHFTFILQKLFLKSTILGDYDEN